MKVLTERNPDWIKWIAPERFDDKELFRIVIFFVFHSPCANLSSMGKTLAEYGWSAPWRKPFYLNKQLQQAASNYKLIYPASNYVPYKIGKLQIQGFSEPATPKNKITELSHYAKGRPVKTTGGLFAWNARKEAEIF